MLSSFRIPAPIQAKEPPKRQAPANKKWHHKVRSGCLRCKIRKIKCGEEQPVCLRCHKAGFKCGYDIPKTRVFTIDDELKFDSPGDKRFYDFFVNEGSSLLTTFQPSSMTFWLRLAPQLSRKNPAVQHGLTALGAIQAPLHHGVPGAAVTTRRPEMDSTALNYFLKSMNCLINADAASMSPEVSLTCCLCFTAIAIWTEKVGAPVVHIDAGLRMLRDYRKQVEKDPLRRSEALEQGFVGPFEMLVVNACAFSDDYPTANSGIATNYALDKELDSASYLLNVTDAIDSVNTILKCIFRLNDGHTSEGIRQKVDHALIQFSRSLEELHERDKKTSKDRGHPETVDLHALRHLRINHRVAFIMFHAQEAGNEMDFDLFQDDFIYILNESREYVSRAQEQRSGQPGNLQTSLGVIPPLFFVATKCRDSAVRRYALELLHSSMQTERGWTSCMAKGLAEFVIETEEAGPGMIRSHLVPIENRISLERVEHSSADGRTYLEYRNCVDKDTTPNRTTTLPFRRSRSAETDEIKYPMSRKVLRACGYTGVVLFTPKISCHCAWNGRRSSSVVSETSHLAISGVGPSRYMDCDLQMRT